MSHRADGILVLTGLDSGQEAGVKVDSGDNLGDTLASGTIWIRVIIATVCKSAVLQARESLAHLIFPSTYKESIFPNWLNSNFDKFTWFV